MTIAADVIDPRTIEITQLGNELGQPWRCDVALLRDTEPLPRTERIVAGATTSLGWGESDELDHLVGPASVQAHRHRADDEQLASGAPGVLGRGVQQHADVAAGIRQPTIIGAQHQTPTG